MGLPNLHWTNVLGPIKNSPEAYGTAMVLVCLGRQELLALSLVTSWVRLAAALVWVIDVHAEPFFVANANKYFWTFFTTRWKWVNRREICRQSPLELVKPTVNLSPGRSFVVFTILHSSRLEMSWPYCTFTVFLTPSVASVMFLSKQWAFCTCSRRTVTIKFCWFIGGGI